LASEIEQHEIAQTEQDDERSRRLKIFAERLFARLPADLTDDFPLARRLTLAEAGYDFFANRVESLAVRISAGSSEGLLALETLMPDCPFIVDTIQEYFRKQGTPVRLLLHPRFNVSRDEDGALVSFEQASSGERPESFTHTEIEIVPQTPAPTVIENDLRRVLGEVQEVTGDFAAMTARALQICEETAAQRELVEIRDFIRWLVQGGFVFMGYRRYRVTTDDGHRALVAEPGSGLGIMRAETRSRYLAPVAVDALEDAHRSLLFDGSPLIVGKCHVESEVHRRAPMDDITIRRTDASGEPEAFDRFIGLFTSKAYAEEAQHIPVLRAKLGELIVAERVQPGTHDYKALVTAFNSFPKEELFRGRLDELRPQLKAVLDAKSEATVRLSVEVDAVRGNVIALVIMPRENFSAEVRLRIQETLAARLGGKLVYYYLALGEGYTARLHFCFAAPAPADATVEELEAEIAALARSWDDLLREELLSHFEAARAHQLGARWIPAFNVQYKAATSVALALGDIEQVERLLGNNHFSVLIGSAAAAADGPDTSELRLYELDEAPILSELIPELQNFGISVLSEDAHKFDLTIDGQPRAAYVQAFRARSLDGNALEHKPGASLLADALVAVHSGRAEDDPLNALTLNGGLSWREVAVMRGYLAAAVQMRLAPARPAVRRPVLLHPGIARVLVDLFKARFDPDHETPAAKVSELRTAYLDHLAAIENIADDRVARTLLSMVEATVRTNYFCAIPDPDPYVALKFESGRIPNLPDIPPLYEIHVSSPRMEGCHLRGGRIARGGIRYSDRPDDYRTEILELMKTQTVKNAIIVPVGAKGGFIVKSRAGRVPDPEAVIEAYTTLINAMLDLTDNAVEGRVIHPERVRVLDTDDPYLVVAADKGTAAFSDVANGIAESRSFWLGDAFASGGEHGYDHKKLGITARGAWESAKRHLREMGRDIGRGAPITIVGIGDMSGDVFGNGLLQSENVKLVAAFDHRHIFIDPDPDPLKSFAERKRLYEKAGSQWSDYDPALISRGGGVFRRGLKRIVLTAEARAALNCEAPELDSDSLVQAILRASVDLLYNGGIGTYVRAEDETDAEVGDHANDSCRITAHELRCKVVVEGGNLGFTQKARIEYALAGGRINNDAIDNSAGVDMSDHEVNLKILLQPAVARGTLTSPERNRRLAAVANEVAANVLRDNRDQVLSLSLEQIRSGAQTHAFRELLTAIEQRGMLRYHAAALPTLEELNERRTRFSGFTRPELAVVSAYTKIDLTSRFEGTALIGDPYLLERFLYPYFPAPIAASFADDIPRHGLRNELIATRAINEIVDLMGSTFVFNLMRDHGIETEGALRAYLVAAGVLELRERAGGLKTSAGELSAEAELDAFLELGRAARRACTWAVANAEGSNSIGEVVGRFKPAFDRLAQEFENVLTDGERDRFERTYRELRSAVHQEQLALELARLAFADHLLNVVSLSFARGIEPMAVASVYFGLSECIEFAMLEGAIDSINSEDRWERRAARDLGAELTWARTQLCCALMDQGDADLPMANRIARDREHRAAEVMRLMADLRTLTTIGLPPLQVTVRALARLANTASSVLSSAHGG
jgi:glutamate dehydrogenase